MQSVDVKSLIEPKLNEIWQNPEYHRNSEIQEVIQRGYLAHSQIPVDTIVFVGINPSFDKNQRSVVSKSEGRWGEFTDLKQEDNEYQKYFGKFEGIAANLKQTWDSIKWTHIDMLYFRETKQSFIKDVLMKDELGRRFIAEQLEITKTIIEKITPKILVVSNTAARDFFVDKDGSFGYKFNYKLLFNNDLGTHILELDSNGKVKKIPTFFTSMLTGQRALDNGSFERLQWHIEFALNKLDEL
jgi:hypothetical protein